MVMPALPLSCRMAWCLAHTCCREAKPILDSTGSLIQSISNTILGVPIVHQLAVPLNMQSASIINLERWPDDTPPCRIPEAQIVPSIIG